MASENTDHWATKASSIMRTESVLDFEDGIRPLVQQSIRKHITRLYMPGKGVLVFQDGIRPPNRGRFWKTFQNFSSSILRDGGGQMTRHLKRNLGGDSSAWMENALAYFESRKQGDALDSAYEFKRAFCALEVSSSSTNLFQSLRRCFGCHRHLASCLASEALRVKNFITTKTTECQLYVSPASPQNWWPPYGLDFKAAIASTFLMISGNAFPIHSQHTRLCFSSR